VAPRAPARDVRIRSGEGVDRWVVTYLASAPSGALHVLLVRDLMNTAEAIQFLLTTHSCFRVW
jgi:hypothetical protein